MRWALIRLKQSIKKSKMLIITVLKKLKVIGFCSYLC